MTRNNYNKLNTVNTDNKDNIEINLYNTLSPRNQENLYQKTKDYTQTSSVIYYSTPESNTYGNRIAHNNYTYDYNNKTFEY